MADIVVSVRESHRYIKRGLIENLSYSEKFFDKIIEVQLHRFWPRDMCDIRLVRVWFTRNHAHPFKTHPKIIAFLREVTPDR